MKPPFDRREFLQRAGAMGAAVLLPGLHTPVRAASKAPTAPVSITSGTLNVTLGDTGNGTFVVADAIAVIPLP